MLYRAHDHLPRRISCVSRNGCCGQGAARGVIGRHRSALLDRLVQFLDDKLPARFWDKVVPEPMSGCWLWVAATSSTGYGNYWDADAKRYLHPHKTISDIVHGQRGPGMHVDHKCRNRSCCNPDHLEVVTHRENMLRASRLKTACPVGHPYDDGNTVMEPGGCGYPVRKCRTCVNERARNKRRRQRDSRRPSSPPGNTSAEMSTRPHPGASDG